MAKTEPMIRKLLPPLALVGALALVPAVTATQAASDAQTYKELETFMGVFERVRANYVDKVDDHKLIKGAILKEYPGAPHGLFITDKDQLAADLATFVGSGTVTEPV